jgi:hypothetical protein
MPSVTRRTPPATCNIEAHHRYETPTWLTARLTRFAFSGCDNEHSQAQRGIGYDYLTRQVAALDATEKGHLGLVSYYTERGEIPGVWMGSGMAGIDGLNPGDVVTAEQMRALFGVGLHPLAAQRQRQLQGRTWRCGITRR